MSAQASRALRVTTISPLPDTEPSHDCALCPRLVETRMACRAAQPDWWNAPVPAFGDPEAWLAIVGLAPGKQGANRTGRAFTGDASGELLWATLTKFGFVDEPPQPAHPEPVEGSSSEEAPNIEISADQPFDRLRVSGTELPEITLNGAIIFNAVRCLPPGNKPTPEEIRTCRPYLRSGFDALPNLRTIIALGEIAHQSAVKANGEKLPKRRFAHGAVHQLLNGRVLIDSYHPSQLNQNTGRLTVDMFEDVFGVSLAFR
jgi:uracil-DNA glycosylase